MNKALRQLNFNHLFIKVLTLGIMALIYSKAKPLWKVYASILQPKIVFCFGSHVDKFPRESYPQGCPLLVADLPHQQDKEGFKDEFYRHLYFSQILEGLYKANILSLEEAESKYRMFLKG